MEFLIVFALAVIYQWIFLPILKKGIGYEQEESDRIFYNYKTKWHMPFELALVVVTVLLIYLFTPALGNGTILLVPIGLIVILMMRGLLERKYIPTKRHHVISFIQVIVLVVAFGSIALYGLFINN